MGWRNSTAAGTAEIAHVLFGLGFMGALSLELLGTSHRLLGHEQRYIAIAALGGAGHEHKLHRLTMALGVRNNSLSCCCVVCAVSQLFTCDLAIYVSRPDDKQTSK